MFPCTAQRSRRLSSLDGGGRHVTTTGDPESARRDWRVALSTDPLAPWCNNVDRFVQFATGNHVQTWYTRCIIGRFFSCAVPGGGIRRQYGESRTS